VKILRIAREVHASAGKSSAKNVASSLWLELIGAQRRHYNPNCFVENFSLTPGLSRVQKVRREKTV